MQDHNPSCQLGTDRVTCVWSRMPRSLLVPWLPCLLLLCQPGTTASAQTPPATVVDIRVEQEGQVVSDPLILGLIETKAGAPLSVADVRESITHLTSLTRFEDVQVFEETGASGVRLRYVLFPIHAVDRLEFRGTLGLPEADLRHAVTDRFGPAPPAARADEIVRSLQLVYRDRGYLEPRISHRIDITNNPDRASMVIEVDAGPRVLIQRI